MKYVLLIALALGLIWWWRLLVRKNQARPKDAAPASPPPPGPADDMIACDHCGLHLPRSEALIGARGTYCSAAHREATEGRSQGS
ncbi:MAG: hypothetical protein FJY42_04785 [Betaproteobacteria bacterium]|nr:hypothetical protein [Betaproteobacteria bacterium]